MKTALNFTVVCFTLLLFLLVLREDFNASRAIDVNQCQNVVSLLVRLSVVVFKNLFVFRAEWVELWMWASGRTHQLRCVSSTTFSCVRTRSVFLVCLFVCLFVFYVSLTTFICVQIWPIIQIKFEQLLTSVILLSVLKLDLSLFLYFSLLVCLVSILVFLRKRILFVLWTDML